MNELKTYTLNFRCTNCFHEFCAAILFGKRVKYGGGKLYWEGFDQQLIFIKCPKCGVDSDIEKDIEKDISKTEEE